MRLGGMLPHSSLKGAGHRLNWSWCWLSSMPAQLISQVPKDIVATTSRYCGWRRVEELYAIASQWCFMC